MCGVWTQEQWQKAAEMPGSKYSVVGRFQNAEGQTALQIKETYPDGSYCWNVYTKDGEGHAFYYDQPSAMRAMAKRGFTPLVATETTAQVDTAGVILVETTTPENQTTPDDGVAAGVRPEQVRVQGKTLAEWEEEGRLNDEREEHVHPEDPDGDPSDDEIAAFEASLSADEKEFIELAAMVHALGGASIFS